MSGLLVLLALGAVSVDVPDSGVQTPSGERAEPRRYNEINADIRQVLRAEALADTVQERAPSIRKMATLYRELVKDPRLETSDTLKKYKAKLWSRMTHIKTDLERQIERDAKKAKRGKRDEDLLAVQTATRSLAEQMSLMNYTMGGPSYVLQHSGGAFGGGARYDHGQELVDLIQRTIKPDTWDVNGGTGSIFYYRPLMALVVRATSEVHGNVGGLLGALR